ncbi:imidazole glycerol phosphate synthase subunit HisH [Candidatus Vidania fulgoroideorum]
MKIGLFNLGHGNIYSIKSSFKKIGIKKIIFIKNKNDFIKCKKIIFPGQGNSNIIKKNIKNIDLTNKLKKEILKGKHFLGICLGMQIMYNFNEESNINGIGFFKEKVKILKKKNVPCIGWCKTEMRKNLLKKNFFYHSHSYYTELNKYSFGYVYYYIYFSSICIRKNLFLTQFHPEISGKNGLEIIKNFLKCK